MNAEKRAVLISAIDELRQEVRGSWVHWINITASGDLNPDEIVDILLTACDDGESSVQILECDNKFDSFEGPSFRMLPEWWDYLNRLATGGEA